MEPYHKILNVWKRDPVKNFKYLVEGAWSSDVFEYLALNDWDLYEKVDGTNIRVMWDGVNVTVNGRTDNAQIPGDLVTYLYKTFTVDAMRKHFPPAELAEESICLYGEGYGAGIQKGGGNYRPDKGFILFDVKIGSYWLIRESVEDIAKGLNIPVVPFITRTTLIDAVEFVRKGFDSALRSTPPEGVIARPVVQLFDRYGQRVMCKIKIKDFER